MNISKRLTFSMLSIGFMLPLFAQTSGNLSFSCTTYAPSGDWGNKHVSAIWIQNNENPSIFIKTNAKYGYEDDHLTSWSAISGKNLVDAVTGSTLSSYGTLSVEWDGTDPSHNVVMDGDYSLYIEMGWGKNKTSDHAVEHYIFTKGSSMQNLTPTGNSNFSDISLSWEPSTTLISAVEDKNGISIFPNPSIGEIELSFQKELINTRIIISNMAGKTFYSETIELAVGIKKLNMTDIPNGMYLLSVHSEKNYFTYKILINK